MSESRMTWKAAAEMARGLGITIRATGWGAERAVYFRGEGKDSPAAHFTDCPEDAAGTARAMWRERQGAERAGFGSILFRERFALPPLSGLAAGA